MTVPRYRHEREELSPPPVPPAAPPATARLSSLGNSLAANILNYLGNMLPGKGKVPGRHSHSLKVLI